MEVFLEICGLLLKLFGIYGGIIALATLLPRLRHPQRGPKTRFAVILAARNEAPVIGRTVRQLLLQNYPRDLYDVYVVPNNCTDDTAFQAASAGAKVLECTVPVRDKGGALAFAFSALKDQGYDAYCVFDADNLVDPAFLSRMNDAFLSGARIAKGVHRASNPGDGWIAGGYDLYFENFHVIYSRPRARLGLSAKLMGTGFAVSRELLEEMGGFQTRTLTEDSEFAIQCALHGERIHYVPDAVTWDEQPLGFRVSCVQRRRWSSGVVQILRLYGGKLLKGCFRPGRRRFCADALMMLMGPVMQVVGVFPALALVWNAVARGQWLELALGVAGFWLGMTAMALGLAIVGRRKLRPLVPAILLYPLFLATWYPISVWSVLFPAKKWKPIAHGVSKSCTVPQKPKALQEQAG